MASDKKNNRAYSKKCANHTSESVLMKVYD